MPKGQEIIPIEGANMDVHQSILKKTMVPYIKNLTSTVNRNQKQGSEGSNLFALQPMQASQAYTPTLPEEGNNAFVGYKEYIERNSSFTFIWNEEGNHLIYRTDGNIGVSTNVYQGSKLGFSLNPENYIVGDGRVVIQRATRLNRATGKQDELTFLIWTNNDKEVRFLCVEDSIASDSFNATTFPFFANNEPDFDTEEFLQLGVAQPKLPITFTKIAPSSDDLAKPNQINFRGLQFRARFIDIWGRSSDYGPVSDMFINVFGGICNTASVSRTIKLTLPAGNSIIDKVELLVRQWNGNSPGLSTETDWYLYDTIEKYQYNNPTDRWFERAFISTLNYNGATNTIEYLFSNEKQWVPVDVTRTNRNFNPLTLRASSIFPMNRRMGMSRLEKGYDKLDDLQLNKLEFTVTPPDGSACTSQIPLRKLTVYCCIWNPTDQQPVELRNNTGGTGQNRIVYGSADCYNRENNPFIYGQVLPVNQEGIIASLAGTPYYQISKQYRYDRSTGKEEYIGINWDDLGDAGRYIPVQKWEFNVPPGQYKFWVASPQAAPTDDYQKTSTKFVGLQSINNLGNATQYMKEIIVDLCTTDATYLDECVMIFDGCTEGKNDCEHTDRNSVVEGYLYEDEINKLPIEYAKVDNNVGGDGFSCNYTDHNGFYWYIAKNYGLQVTLKGYKNCVPDNDLIQSDTAYDAGGAHYRFNNLYVYKLLTPYPPNDRYIVTGKLQVCDGTAGIGGALVCLEGGQFAFTLEDGTFSIPAHFIGDSNNHRTAKVIYSQKGSCQLIACSGGCDNFCLGSVVTSTSPSCQTDGTTSQEVDTGTKSFQLRTISKSGPRMGSRLQGGIVLHDWLGRETFVQTKDKHIIDIPSVQETGVWDFSKIGFNLHDMVFPLSTKRISFFLTENLNEEDGLQWVADKVEYVDNAGEINNVAPTFLRIYYRSLTEYNKQNNFSTNTVWQVIAENATLPITGDEVEFISKGDGTLFTQRLRSQVTYDKGGQYFQVEYRTELANLTNNVLFSFVRINKTNSQPFYYEIPLLIPVANGVPATLTGILNLKNSYLLYRQIPVPVDTEIPDPADATKTITNTNTELRNYPFPFEHHSPSDLWGDHCWNKGRVSTYNPYEKKLFFRTGTDVTGELAKTGLLNELNFIDEANQVLFDEQEWGGIVIGIPEISRILFICEHNNFIVSFDDNRVYVGDNGQVQTNKGEKQFGRPDRKIGSNYGCQMWEINTISKEKGKIIYLDASESALVVHDYMQAIDISDEAGIKGWLLSKVKYIASYNSFADDKKFFIGVIDPKTKNYIFSDTIQRPWLSAGDPYINTLPADDVSKGETMIVDIYYKQFKGAASFVPEGYGSLRGDQADMQLISYKKGVGWYHYDSRSTATSYCNFFGVQVQPYIQYAFNLDARNIKAWRYMEVFCKQVLLFADEIKTSRGQLSRIMPLWWQPINKMYAADFKCDLNTPVDDMLPTQTNSTNKILDGDPLFGEWITVRLTTKQADRDKYFELLSAIAYMDSDSKIDSSE